MAIAYLFSLEELAVLAHFAGEHVLVGFEPLPAVNEERCDRLLSGLCEKGMITLSGDTASVPAPLRLILAVLAHPVLSVRAVGDVWAHCTPELGTLVTGAPHSKTRWRILPVPTARELTERLWEEGGICFERAEFTVCHSGNSAEKKELTRQELEEILLTIYKEEPVE